MLQVLEFRMVTQAARERVSFTALTFTTPLFWYSFQFASSELNRSLYDVTHWSSDGLPCVAISFTTLSFPRSICKYCPIAFWRVDQEPELPLFWILLRRACHGSYPELQNEDAFTASFILSLYFPFQGPEYGILWAETQILIYIHLYRSSSNEDYKETLRFYGAKKLGLDLYRIQIAQSSELVRSGAYE